MIKLVIGLPCLLCGLGAIVFALNPPPHPAVFGLRNQDALGAAAMVFLVCAPVGATLLWSWFGKEKAFAVLPSRPEVNEEAQRHGLKAGVYGLIPGTTYRVIRPFADCYGGGFALGEELIFVQRHFLPFHGGHTVEFMRRTMYLQEQKNADVLDALDTYLEVVSGPVKAGVPPPSALPARRPLRVWQEKYSSTEMICLLLYEDEVALELQALGLHRDTWTHDQVLAGAADRDILRGFAREVADELKAEIRSFSR